MENVESVCEHTVEKFYKKDAKRAILARKCNYARCLIKKPFFSMKLSVITVTYQSAEYIGGCILSVMANVLHLPYEHIIIDNGSTDGTVELLEKEFSSYITLIKNTENKGFSKANNQGVEVATGDVFLFLNPDMQILDNFLDPLVLWLQERKDVGIVGCKLVNSDKQCHLLLRPPRFPKLWDFFLYYLLLDPAFLPYPIEFADDIEQEVDQIRGAFMLMRREVIEKVGYAFNPSYFILYEDVDICKTMRKLGYKVVYNPMISCMDHLGRSFFTQPRIWKYLEFSRSIQKYTQIWHSPFHLIWLKPLSYIGLVLRIFKWGIRRAKKFFSKKIQLRGEFSF